TGAWWSLPLLLGGRRALLGGGLAGGGAAGGGLLRRGLGGLLGEQVVGALGGDRLHGVVPAQRGVRRPVGDVRAEASVLDDHWLAAGRVLPELAQRRPGGLPAAALGLLVQLEGLLEGDLE